MIANDDTEESSGDEYETQDSPGEDSDDESEMLYGVLNELDKVILEEVSCAVDEHLDVLGTLPDNNQCTSSTVQNSQLGDLEISFEGMQLSQNKEDTDSTSIPMPEHFDLTKYVPPPLLTRHPEPFIGRDDDPVKLKEIITDVMIKMGIYEGSPDNSKTILIGPDHKIAQNVLKLAKLLIQNFPACSIYGNPT